MQNNRTSLARRFFVGLCAAAALALVGCQQVAITNLTPGTLPENPSQIYTFTARIAPKDTGYVKDSVRPMIIVDGKSFPMRKSGLGQDIFEFDYQVGPGRSDFAYYYLINYQVEGNDGILRSRTDYTPVQRASVVGRYVLSLEVVRGPVGARVSILGRGFNPTDVVYFDGTPVRTVFDSPNSLSFFVPPLEPNKNYKVTLGNATASSPAGTFRIDAIAGTPDATTEAFGSAPGVTTGPLTVAPASLALKPGQKATLTFTLPVNAPAGGTLIDITTDIPNSVIMPEVVVPAGTNTVTVTVQGGTAGSGSLVARGPGVRELSIPVTVK